MTLPTPHFHRLLLLLLLLPLVLGACASTRFSSDTPSGPGLPGEQLLVMVSAQDENLRRMSENQILANLTPANRARTAHSLGIDAGITETALRQRIRNAGFDRVLLLRIAAIEKRTVHYPATPYDYGDPLMWGWPAGWHPRFPYGYAPFAPLSAPPPRIVEELAVSVESQLIALPDGTPLWRGLSHTMTAGTAAQALEDVAKTVVQTLTERHWLRPD